MQLIQVKNRIWNTRHKLVCLAALGLLTWLPARAQVKELYLKGIARSEQGAYREARMHFEEALTYDRDDPDCLLRLAEACQRSGDPQAALEYLQQAEAVAPGIGSYLLATIHASSGNAREAVKHLESHLSSPYKLPSHRILLDDAFLAIEDSPEWRSLWTGTWYTEDEELLQEIHYLAGSDESLQALEKIDTELEEREDWDALHAARGNVLLGMEQYNGAIQAYSRAIEINAANPSYHYGRAQSYIAQEKYENALPGLERAYRMEPEKLELLMEIAQVYHKAGRFSKAAVYMERYLEFYPEKTEAHFLYGQICFDSGQYIDALDQFNACLQLETTDPRYFAARGKTYLKTKTYTYALNDLGMALDLDPNDHEVWYHRGLVRWYLNEREGALRDWERAARLGSFKAAQKLEKHARKN